MGEVEGAGKDRERGPLLLGRVQAPDGSPVAGALVTFEVPDPSTRRFPGRRTVADVPSDPSGHFDFRLPETYGRVLAETEEWTTVMPYEFVPGRLEEAIVVVGRHNAYAGVVVDAEGRGIADARIVVAMSPGTELRLHLGRERSHALEWETRTEGNGRFDLERIGWTEGLGLTATSTGLRPGKLVLAETSDLDLRIILGGESKFLTGAVVDADGEPAPGATVFLDAASSTADAGGRFAFPRPDLAAEHALVAVKEHRLPARLTFGSGIEVPEPLVLVLGGPPLSISGRTVDGRGEPIAGAFVWIDDRTFLDRVVQTSSGGVGMTGVATAEDLMAGSTGPFKPFRSGVDGGFEVRGLLPRAYSLSASDPRTVALVTMPAVEAGTKDLIFVLEEASPVHRVAGRVLTLSGSPLPGIRVLVGRSSERASGYISAPLVTQGVPVTDAEGRFAFEGLHVEGCRLVFAGDSITIDDSRLELDPTEDLEHLEVRFPVKCSFQIQLLDAAEADAFGTWDETGRGLEMESRVGGAVQTSSLSWFVDGVSEVISTGENARWLVLMKAGKEVRRIPIELVVGEVTTIRP